MGRSISQASEKSITAYLEGHARQRTPAAGATAAHATLLFGKTHTTVTLTQAGQTAAQVRFTPLSKASEVGSGKSVQAGKRPQCTGPFGVTTNTV